MRIKILFLVCLYLINVINANNNQSISFLFNNNKYVHQNETDKIPVNILLLLPLNDTYKFSLSKVSLALNMAISELKYTDYGSKFKIDIMPDTCDCTSIKAPVNAMENIYRTRNHTKRFQAVFGPMCD